ncbi:MAG: hypothetical protein QGH20_07475, partial [Candidatus Latescibacteria bacterium]|nr:hypothetical protein [Candidatus Latescibacterota bacterium]
MSASFETGTMRWAIGAGGLTEELVDRASGVDYSIQSPNSPCALVRRGDIEYPATKASVDGHRVVLEFGGAGVTAELEISANERYV